jgi:single-stranded-DNA-specific exonuclease
VKTKWQILPCDIATANDLQDSLRINPTLCSIITQRGYTNYEDAKDYFRPSLEKLHSPWMMKDMRKAVERIEKAIISSEKILVFGDYDVDGTTAVASFYQFLSYLYQSDKTDFYIPHRYKEGYGVSKIGIDYAKQKGFSLIVCLDCGIKSVELISYAQSIGIDFIICDHHLPGSVLPNAVAILNPKQNDCTYPFKELCGCGIGFKLMMALAEYFNLDADTYWRFLDLVAIAIAADIVPMNGENRILAYHGLKKINESPSLGIKTIIELSGLKKQLTISNVVFMIAPRVNAAGRMDDAKKAVLLFMETDESKALELGNMLQSDNTERKETDASITQEALDIINENPALAKQKSCVLYREHWHKGVVGIVASRVIEHYYRPTIILTLSDGIVTGSARSVKGFNLYEAIFECREYLLAFGGHFAAAGLSMLPENVTAFSKKFEEVVSRTISPDSLVPEIVIDAKINFNEITPTFYHIISQMEPFGPENMRPVFIAEHVSDFGYSKVLKEQHIKFELKQNQHKISGIGFRMAEHFELLKNNQPIDIVFTVDENEWNGKKEIQIKVIDFRKSENKNLLN